MRADLHAQQRSRCLPDGDRADRADRNELFVEKDVLDAVHLAGRHLVDDFDVVDLLTKLDPEQCAQLLDIAAADCSPAPSVAA